MNHTRRATLPGLTAPAVPWAPVHLQVAKIRECFAALDVNGDGVVDPEEAIQVGTDTIRVRH